MRVRDDMNQTTDLMIKLINDYATWVAEIRRMLVELRYESERALNMLSKGSTRFPNTGPLAAKIYVCRVRMEMAVEVMVGLTDEETASAITRKIVRAAFPTITADEIINGLKEKKNND